MVITNDPYATRGMVMHLNDIYVFRPVFADGRLLCLAWPFIHCTDVGAQAEAYRHLHQSGAGPYRTEAIAAALAAVEAALGQPAPVLQQAAQ